jgi:RND superfamily putative drug exporter
VAALLYRLGAFSARHRVAFVIGWLTVVVWLAAGALGGMSTISASPSDAGSFFTIPGAESSKAMATLQREFPDVVASGDADTLRLVVEAPTGERITDPANVEKLAALEASAARIEHVASVANPLDPQTPFFAPDLTTAVVTLTLSGITDQNAGQVEAAVAGLADQARQAGFVAQVGGDPGDAPIEIFGPLEMLGAGVAFLVLVITLGSLIAAGMNMFTALIGVGTGVLGAFAYGALVEPTGPLTPALAVMLGLALGIDYGLFIITRFRAELREGRDVVDAAGRAVATAGSSVTVAGCTVITAVAALAVIGIPPITEIGLAAAFAVAVDVLAAITLIPAVMGMVGRRALTRRERAGTSRRDRRTRPGVLERWASFVVRFRVPCLVAGVAVLAVLAIPVATMRTALTVPGGTDAASSQRAAYNLVLEKFGGAQSPLVVLVEGGRVADALPAVTTALQGLDGAEFVVPGATNHAGTLAFLTVVPRGGPNDQSTKDLVGEIRAIENDTAGVRLSVTGETAIAIDSDAQLRKALIVYLPVIVGVCILLLVVLFRSILVPVIAALGFLLSLGAALGLTVAIFQWGVLGSLLPADVGNPVMSFLPILLTGILFGLAMDYQVFLVSRMHEAHRRGLVPREAILDGFVRSGPVVAAAAAIMGFVFAGFGGATMVSLASIALALAIGVLADAFVVRMLIVPAALAVFGRGAWWLPRWLDRVLPRLDHEGGRVTPSSVDSPGSGETRTPEPALADERR